MEFFLSGNRCHPHAQNLQQKTKIKNEVPMTGHGGKRPGSGRPKKDRTPATGEPIFESAESYLEAVVSGTIPPDPARIQAAKTLIAYQKTKQRAPKKALTPTQMEALEVRAIEDAIAGEFEAKAAEIRARHAKRRKLDNGNS